MEEIVVTRLERLDKFLSRELHLSRREVSLMFQENKVFVEGHRAFGKNTYQIGALINFERLSVKETTLVPYEFKLDVLHEDDMIIVINKPYGLVVHPGHGNTDKTLVNALIKSVKSLSGINGEMRPGIVHRLDKTTSGVIVCCKNDTSHRMLSRAFQDREVLKEYVAIVEGEIKELEGVINAPIKRSKNNPQKMEVSKGGKEAITEFKVVKRVNGYTYLSVKLITGRTHQIRVHLSYIKHPIVGDSLYGSKTKASRIMLHARKVGFISPSTKAYVEYICDPPISFSEFLNEK